MQHDRSDYQILFFSSNTCAPCGKQTIELQKYEGYQDHIPVQTIKIENDFEAAVLYQVRSVPSIILVNEIGEEILRYNGKCVSVERLLEF